MRAFRFGCGDHNDANGDSDDICGHDDDDGHDGDRGDDEAYDGDDESQSPFFVCTMGRYSRQKDFNQFHFATEYQL